MLTLLMLPPIVAIVLVMINSMASALSLAGVFTLCRYRTVPGDPKDITYVFFAMATGVIWYQQRRSRLVCICILCYYCSRVDSGRSISLQHLQDQQHDLKGDHSGKLELHRSVDDILAQNTTSWHLKRVKTTNFGSLFN
ncbi:MAG: DUF4956 domain-containing protein [Ruminococcus sp.]